MQVVTLSVISGLLALALAEGLLHLFPRLLPLELQVRFGDASDERGVADARIGNLPIPGSSGVIWTRDFRIEHQIDSHGFRNPEPWPEHPDVIVIGDSLVLGYGVAADQAWPAVLESELPGRSVINLGLIGAGPQQYRRIYESFGRALRPRLVIVAMFAANDFWDAEMFEEWLASGVGGNYMEWRDFGRGSRGFNYRRPLGSLRSFLNRESYVYNLLRFVRKARQGVKGRYVLKWSDGVTLQLYPDEREQRVENAEPTGSIFQIVLKSIEAIHDAAVADGSRTLVIFQPSKEYVYMPFVGKPVRHAGKQLLNALAERNIDSLDLGPMYRRRAEEGDRLFFPNDGHPNELGYALTGRAVADYIRRGALLDLTGKPTPAYRSGE
jgi:lysophospholipase L1-like esterase